MSVRLIAVQKTTTTQSKLTLTRCMVASISNGAGMRVTSSMLADCDCNAALEGVAPMKNAKVALAAPWQHVLQKSNCLISS